LVFEPTDMRKAAKLMRSPNLAALTYTTPNVKELATMAGADRLAASPREVAEQCVSLLKGGVQVVVTTLGSDGAVLVRRGHPEDPLPTRNDPNSSVANISAVHYSGKVISDVASVSGAGDCFAAAFLTAVFRENLPQSGVMAAAMQAALLSLRSSSAVPESLTSEAIDWREKNVSGREIHL